MAGEWAPHAPALALALSLRSEAISGLPLFVIASEAWRSRVGLPPEVEIAASLRSSQ